MNKEKQILNFQNKWDTIINSFNGNFRSKEIIDKFFSGEFYTYSSADKMLNERALPEPYLGDPSNCSIVCLNLNPGQYLEAFQNPINGIFITKGNALKSYSKFAKKFPYLNDDYKIKNDKALNGGHKWWEKRNNYFKRVFNYSGDSLPFALEICPWRSAKFGNLKINSEFLSYVENNVFDIASIISLKAEINFVFSVGADFRRLFEKIPSRFIKLQEVSDKNSIELGYIFPRKKNNVLIKRRISIWKDTKYNVHYINTSAQGGNTNPSPDFDLVIRRLISENIKL